MSPHNSPAGNGTSHYHPLPRKHKDLPTKAALLFKDPLSIAPVGDLVPKRIHVTAPEMKSSTSPLGAAPLKGFVSLPGSDNFSGQAWKINTLIQQGGPNLLQLLQLQQGLSASAVAAASGPPATSYPSQQFPLHQQGNQQLHMTQQHQSHKAPLFSLNTVLAALESQSLLAVSGTHIQPGMVRHPPGLGGLQQPGLGLGLAQTGLAPQQQKLPLLSPLDIQSLQMSRFGGFPMSGLAPSNLSQLPLSGLAPPNLSLLPMSGLAPPTLSQLQALLSASHHQSGIGGFQQAGLGFPQTGLAPQQQQQQQQQCHQQSDKGTGAMNAPLPSIQPFMLWQSNPNLKAQGPVPVSADPANKSRGMLWKSDLFRTQGPGPASAAPANGSGGAGGVASKGGPQFPPSKRHKSERQRSESELSPRP